MEIIALEEKRYFEIIMRAVQILHEGKVIAVPTDTVYGFAVDATNDKAVKRLFQIKKREEGKPVPVVVDAMARAKQIAFIEERKLEETLKEYWFTRHSLGEGEPGAFTAILYAREIVSPLARGRGGLTVGVRIPDHRFLRDLARAFGKPITGASANRSGQRPATTAEEIFSLEGIDMIIDGGICAAPPSMVIDFTVVPPKMVRV